MTGFAINLDLGDLCDHRLAAEGICDAAPCENIPRAQRFRRGTMVPTVSFHRRLHDSDGTRALERVVISRRGGEEPHPEIDRVGLRCCRQLVDK